MYYILIQHGPGRWDAQNDRWQFDTAEEAHAEANRWVASGNLTKKWAVVAFIDGQYVFPNYGDSDTFGTVRISAITIWAAGKAFEQGLTSGRYFARS